MGASNAAVDLTAFIDLLSEINELFGSIDAALQQPCENIDIHELFRFYHTLKGAVTVYALDQIVVHTHAIEDRMEFIRYRNNALKKPEKLHLLEATYVLKVVVAKSLKPLYAKLNKQTANKYRLPPLSLVCNATTKKQTAIPPSIPEVGDRSLAAVMERCATVAKSVAQSQGKKLKVKISGSEIVVNHSKLRPLFSNALHIMRNAIDHGIEKPHVRRSKGKQEVGELKLIARKNQGLFTLYIADDGAGINTNHIRSEAIDKGLISPLAAPTVSNKKLMRLIFTPGFSLKKTVSTISGRGVGMNAVKVAVDQLKGKISVHSVANKGTIIKITVPLLT